MLTKQAAAENYELGVNAALEEYAQVKLAANADPRVIKAIVDQIKVAGDNAWAPTLFGPIGAAIAAPEGSRLKATGATLGGGMLGAFGGSLLGALTSAVSRGKISPELAQRLGSYAGMMSGNYAGYKAVVGD